MVAFPTTYVGLPLGAKFKEKAIWDPKLSRSLRKDFQMEVYVPFEKGKINSQQKCRFKYPDLLRLSLFHLSSSAANRLHAIEQKFLWGSFGSDFKYHLVRWNIVKQPLYLGGLGTRDLMLFNEALLGKWL